MRRLLGRTRPTGAQGACASSSDPSTAELLQGCGEEKTFSVAMTGQVDEDLRKHLLRPDGQEEVIFALYQPSNGATRSTALLVDLVHPLDGERMVHRNASFSGDYFLRAAGLAADRDLGVALLHSHPNGVGWQGMSGDDSAAEAGHATGAHVITGLPLVGLTLAGADLSYSARRWVRDQSTGTGAPWRDQQAVTVRVVGERIRVSFNNLLLPVPPQTRRTLRTVQSWGRLAHQDLIRLRVGVIGAGSVAQPVAESLVRTGFMHVDVFDFDLNEEHNLDRLLHATSDDIGLFKVSTLVDQLRRRTVTPGAVVHGRTDSVVEQVGWLAALDCDVLFSCVDRPWPRYALNIAAYAHLIPVIDGGVAVDVTSPTARQVDAGRDVPDVPDVVDQTPDVVRLAGAEWRAHMVGPDRRCMECLGQYDPGDVAMERAGLLDDSTYLATLPADHRLRRGENVFAFSMACAAAEVLELLRAVLGPSKIHDTGATLSHWTTATTDHDQSDCKPACPFSTSLLAAGDAAPANVAGRHLAAEDKRRRARRKTVDPAEVQSERL